MSSTAVPISTILAGGVGYELGDGTSLAGVADSPMEIDAVASAAAKTARENEAFSKTTFNFSSMIEFQTGNLNLIFANYSDRLRVMKQSINFLLPNVDYLRHVETVIEGLKAKIPPTGSTEKQKLDISKQELEILKRLTLLFPDQSEAFKKAYAKLTDPEKGGKDIELEPEDCNALSQFVNEKEIALRRQDTIVGLFPAGTDILPLSEAFTNTNGKPIEFYGLPPDFDWQAEDAWSQFITIVIKDQRNQESLFKLIKTMDSQTPGGIQSLSIGEPWNQHPLPLPSDSGGVWKWLLSYQDDQGVHGLRFTHRNSSGVGRSWSSFDEFSGSYEDLQKILDGSGNSIFVEAGTSENKVHHGLMEWALTASARSAFDALVTSPSRFNEILLEALPFLYKGNYLSALGLPLGSKNWTPQELIAWYLDSSKESRAAVDALIQDFTVSKVGNQPATTKDSVSDRLKTIQSQYEQLRNSFNQQLNAAS